MMTYKLRRRPDNYKPQRTIKSSAPEIVVSATILQFPNRRQLAIIVERERDADGWLVIRGSHGWLHGSAASAFLEAQQLASIDSVAVVQR